MKYNSRCYSVRSYWQVLQGGVKPPVPWRSIWRVEAPFNFLLKIISKERAIVLLVGVLCACVR